MQQVEGRNHIHMCSHLQFLIITNITALNINNNDVFHMLLIIIIIVVIVANSEKIQVIKSIGAFISFSVIYLLLSYRIEVVSISVAAVSIHATIHHKNNNDMHWIVANVWNCIRIKNKIINNKFWNGRST